MTVSNRWKHSCSLAIAAVLGVFGHTLSAAGSMTPWSGASASAGAFSQTDSQNGPTARASVTGTAALTYQNGNQIEGDGSGPVYTLYPNASAKAEATGNPDSLLHIEANYRSTNPGFHPVYLEGHSPGGIASASWNNDSVQVTPPSGGAVPGEIRLDFGISLDTTGTSLGLEFENLSNPYVRLNANGVYTYLFGTSEAAYQTASRPGTDQHLNYGITTPAGLDTWNFDHNPTNPAIPPIYELLPQATGTFHIDLPLNSLGTSDPFSLSIATNVDLGIQYEMDVHGTVKDFTVSLKDVALPDGTSLTDAGYGVSFASGMTWSQPTVVPEPASVVLLATGLAAAACWKVRRARTGR